MAQAAFSGPDAWGQLGEKKFVPHCLRRPNGIAWANAAALIRACFRAQSFAPIQRSTRQNLKTSPFYY